MYPTIAESQSTGETDLAKACLEHLGREEEVLRSALDGLQQVHAALAVGGPAAQAVALRRSAELAQQGETLRVKRDELRQQAGARLGIPAGLITLKGLADFLGGPAAQEMRRGRERLRLLAQEVETQGKRTAVFTHVALDFVQRLLGAGRGGPQDAGRY
jgi:hypothetical protein